VEVGGQVGAEIDGAEDGMDVGVGIYSEWLVLLLLLLLERGLKFELVTKFA
jgi:hypothetical protein